MSNNRRSANKAKRRALVRQMARTAIAQEDPEPVMEVYCIDEQCNSCDVPVPINQCGDSLTCLDCGGELYEYEELGSDVPMDLFDTMVNSEAALSRAYSHRDMDSTDRTRLTQMVTNANPAATAHSSDTFTCPPDLTGCPIAHRCTVYIPLKIVNECVFLCEKFDTEWIAYLLGNARPGEQDSYEITDIYFPKQRANGVHVDAEDGEIRPGTIAAIHSHVAMGVTPSAEDERHRNHTIELIINRRGEISANGRVTLGCGRFHRGDAIVKFTGTEREEELKQQLSSVLVQEQWKSQATQPSQQSGGHNYSWVPRSPSQQQPTTAHIASPQASGASPASSAIWTAGSGSKPSDYNVNGSGKGRGGSVGN